MKRQIVVGTRGSTVALLEARSVIARLKEEWPETDFRLSTITAKGGGLAGSGDLERALTEERINIAVHALEDFPVVQAEGLELASIPRRLEARVALVGRAGCKSLATLPDGSQVIRASIEGDPDEAEDLGFELADDVLKQGGEAILKLTA